MSMIRDPQGKAEINMEIYGKQNKFLIKLLNLLGFFALLLTFSCQKYDQQKNFHQFFYCDLWKASFIVHYQSDCIPKSNS